MATSDDLETWMPARNHENKSPIQGLHPRSGYFDSRLVETGPAAMIRKEGILLIYNGSMPLILMSLTYLISSMLQFKHYLT
jgi:predicted GH43/DUF377 family glycosyl hydrolase